MVNAKKLRILHLLSQRPDSTGSGMYVQAMIREANKLGYENYLVAGVHSSSCDENDQCESMFVKFYNSDVSYNIPGMSDVMPYESTKFCDLSNDDLLEYKTAFSKVLKKAVKKFKPDVIHSHHLWLMSSFAREFFPNIPMVTTCHGTDLRQFQNCTHLQSEVLKGCKRIDIIMALNEIQKKEISKLYGINSEKIIVTGAGYNNSLFYQEKKFEPNPVQLVYAGKLSNAKGVPWMLRSLKSISCLNWQLHLVGSGSGKELKNCLKLAKEIDKKVIIHGALPQNELAKIIRKSHILILPSFYEGLPLVILEGLASNCRIVCTDLPGVNEILNRLDNLENLCSNDKTYISLVKRPRLKLLDQPYKEDEKTFEQNLTTVIQKQITASLKSPQLDLTKAMDLITSYSWTGIFKKVNEVYMLFFKKH